MTPAKVKAMRARSSSSSSLSRRLRSLRAQAVASGDRSFELVVVGGVPVSAPRSLGSFPNVCQALDRARRFGVSSVVVREWASLPDGVRVHVNSVEWLLSWSRVGALRSGSLPGAHSTGGAKPSTVGGQRSDRGAGQVSKLFFGGLP